MGMTTSHHAREWFLAAALRVCHEYRTMAQYRPKKRVTELLKGTLEIDVHSKLASFFGVTANIFAQGKKEIDVQVWAPTLDAEVKFLMSRRNAFADVRADWDELIKFKNANGKFRQRAWVVFLPRADWFTFRECQVVTKPTGKNYAWKDIAFLLPFAKAYREKGWKKQKLKWRNSPHRVTVIDLGKKKRVRVDIVGDPSDVLWACVYSRLSPEEFGELKSFREIRVAKRTARTIERRFEPDASTMAME